MHVRAEGGCSSEVNSALQDLGPALKETPRPEAESEHCIGSLVLDLLSMHCSPFLGCFTFQGFSALVFSSS